MGHIKKTVTCLPVLLLVIVNGCSLFEEEDKHPIECNIDCSITEGYHAGDYQYVQPVICLSCSTENNNLCRDMRIKTSIRATSKKIVVDFKYIYHPDGICWMWRGPASYDTSLNLDNGTYDLLFKYKKIEDEYTLNITDSSIEIKPLASALTEISPKLFWRYPQNSFMCHFRSRDRDTEYPERDSLLFASFVDSLSAHIELAEFVFPDSGVSPYPRSNWDSKRILVRYFKYESETDFDNAVEILKACIDDFPVDTSYHFFIYLKNWKNKRYDFRVGEL